MLRQIPTFFFVALVLEMNISYSLAFAITLSAAIGHDVWQNTTDLILASPFERYIFENQPKATPCTRRMPRPLRSATSDRRATAAYHTTSALVATAPTTITPTPLAQLHIWYLQNATHTQVATGLTGANLVALTTTYLHSHTVVILSDATPSSDVTPAALGKASTKQTNRHTATNASTVKLSNNTVFHSHATTLDHESLGPTITTIITRTSPCNITTPPTPMPKPRDTAFGHFVDKINSALPYLEACGLLDIVWNVGKFFHTKIQTFRSKRSKLPVVEG
ncbi:hypothetical protein MBLNU13_g06443t1 [Cladosporium sp. NU13]